MSHGFGRGRRIFALAITMVLVAGITAGAAAASARVLGGTAIQIQSAPWTVLVRYVPTGSSVEYDCTGSVLTPNLILTSAFCLYDSSGNLEPAAGISIQAGVSDYETPTSTDHEQDRAVGSYRVHPGFVYSGGEAETDDVAVLTLGTPLDLSGPAVKAIALPAPNAAFPAGTAVSLAGFGEQSPTDSTSSQLESISSTVEAQGKCGAQPLAGMKASNGVVLCASSAASSICSGDGGSPLVTTGASPTLVGIAVAATQSCTAGSETIFTYVGAPEILQFIQGNNSTQPSTAPRASATTSWNLVWYLPLVVGDTLRCTTGGWGGSVTVAYSFVNTASGQVLQTGPSGSYLLPKSALGTTIACKIAVTNSGGTTVETTNPAANIKAAPQVKIEPLAAITGKPGQAITLHVVLRSPPGLSGTFKVCAVLPKILTGLPCRSVEQKPYGNTFDLPFTLTLKLKPSALPGTTRITIDASAGVSTAQASALLRVAKR